MVRWWVLLVHCSPLLCMYSKNCPPTSVGWFLESGTDTCQLSTRVYAPRTHQFKFIFQEPALLHYHCSKKRKSQRTGQRTVGLLGSWFRSIGSLKIFKEPPNTVLA